MSHLITLENVSLAYGLEPLLDHVKLQINKGERVCLIGRNGAGKSSLLKIIEGSVLPDSGQVWRKPTLKMARLTQELPQDKDLTVQAFVAQGMAEAGQLLNCYEDLVHKIEKTHSQQDLIELEKLQHAIDAVDGWKFAQQIKTVLTKLNLNGDDKLSALSGGWQRRAALAKALVIEPELLLLDEPTNHLDLEAIQWMEEQLLNANIGLVFITHDRALLQRLATRIIELDRGQLTSWPGDYDNFLRRKEESLHAEAKQNADFDKKLAQEEKWIRQGIKARRTRNEGRVRALESMRLERSKRREVQGKAAFSVNEGEKSGQLVVEAENISHSFGDKKIIDHFSLRVMRGDRIGLLGPNGVGKSTLLNILLGKLSPQSGTVKLGTNLQIAYFDQLRQKLDLEKTVMDNVIEGRESIEINGQTKHIMSYLGDFLFSPQRARTPVKALSGGECNRLLFAKLFAQPANLLVLDEPTNDLDIETLELLEELLSEYKGTLLLVSHDRAFLDNVVTSTIVFEGDGRLQEYVGGYQDWQKQRSKTTIIAKPVAEKAISKSVERQNKKLSYKEQRELAELPQKIEKLEAKRHELQEKTNDAAFYKNSQDMITQALNELNQLNAEIEQAYARWEQLET
jgi:ABC transport system ATP-binding/permease protein